MPLVDSHCHLDHLDLTPYQGSLTAALENAQAQGVKHFLCVGLTPEKFPTILAIAEQYPQVSASIGIHPDEVMATELTLENLLPFAQHPKVVAIGETGLDYYRDTVSPTIQQARFRMHIQLARVLKKPLIIHTRAAQADTIRVLQEENAQTVGGVFHCFTEDETVARQAIALGFYLSFSGIITFANARDLQQTAQNIPLDKILIETDSPYLSPVPYRGKPNEPARVKLVAAKLAQLKGLSVEEVSDATTQNFRQLFTLASV